MFFKLVKIWNKENGKYKHFDNRKDKTFYTSKIEIGHEAHFFQTYNPKNDVSFTTSIVKNIIFNFNSFEVETNNTIYFFDFLPN